MDNNKVILLMGPTASGKTDLAMAMADQYPVDIISVDSAMIYKGMDIGTSKPSNELLSKYPHKLINIIEPNESYSVATFCHDAKNAIDESLSQKRIPVLVGGTMMYFNALLHGLNDLPKADAKLREELELKAEENGLEYMHELLLELDPEAANRIHPNDPQRIQRALEVYYCSGKTMSSLFTKPKDSILEHYDILPLVIKTDNRHELHKRIANRFHKMLAQGFVEEVRGLFENLEKDCLFPGLKTIGYSQVYKYLRGDYKYDDLIDRGIIATRQLAKRQITWIRKIAKDFYHVDSDYSKELHSSLNNFIIH